MFGFKKKPDPRQAAFKQVISDFENGNGSAVDAAIVLMHTQGNEGIPYLLQAVTSGKLFLPLKIPGDFSSACMVMDGDSTGHFGLFSSQSRCEAFLQKEKTFRSWIPVDFLSILFDAADCLGMVLNPDDEHLSFTVSPANMERFRVLFRTSFSPKKGGYYWVDGGEAKVVKLLESDERGVHIRIYSNVFSKKPSALSPADLSLNNPENSPIRAIGHLPLTLDHFLAWSPSLIQEGEISGDELEGYQIWKENAGGYF